MADHHVEFDFGDCLASIIFAGRIGMLHMMFKLGQCAEKKWRRLRGFDYVAKVITGVKFKDGIEVTDVDQITA